MALSFPSVIMSRNEAEGIIGAKLEFTKKGFFIDKDLTVQKKFEDYCGQPIMTILHTTQDTINLVMEPYGVIKENPLTGKRMAILKGDAEYIMSALKLMIQMHPDVKPQTIIDSYAFQCADPHDNLTIREWTKKTYNCV